MKEIVKEVKTIKKEYEAFDGTVFEYKDECLSYEKTAKCVIMKNYKDTIVHTASELDIFNAGSEEYYIDFVDVSTPANVEAVMRMLELYKRHNDVARQHIKTAIEDNDYLLIGHSDYDDVYDVISTRLQTITLIKKNMLFSIDND